jgi:hypothetical protein
MVIDRDAKTPPLFAPQAAAGDDRVACRGLREAEISIEVLGRTAISIQLAALDEGVDRGGAEVKRKRGRR